MTISEDTDRADLILSFKELQRQLRKLRDTMGDEELGDALDAVAEDFGLSPGSHPGSHFGPRHRRTTAGEIGPLR